MRHPLLRKTFMACAYPNFRAWQILFQKAVEIGMPSVNPL
jgi:hypothetical protein